MTTSSAKRTVQRTKRFGRDVKKLPPPVQQNAYEVAQPLAIDVCHPQLNIKPLTGFKQIYSLVTTLRVVMQRGRSASSAAPW